eukprot:5197675-Prymnesium_polylepis.3
MTLECGEHLHAFSPRSTKFFGPDRWQQSWRQGHTRAARGVGVGALRGIWQEGAGGMDGRRGVAK